MAFLPADNFEIYTDSLAEANRLIRVNLASANELGPNGLTYPNVSSLEDSDVESNAMMKALEAFDDCINTTTFIKGFTEFATAITALEKSAVVAGYDSLDDFCTQNEALVSPFFSSLYNDLKGRHFSARNVFAEDGSNMEFVGEDIVLAEILLGTPTGPIVHAGIPSSVVVGSPKPYTSPYTATNYGDIRSWDQQTGLEQTPVPFSDAVTYPGARLLVGIYDGKLYVLTKVGPVGGSTTNWKFNLQAYDKSTGEAVWENPVVITDNFFSVDVDVLNFGMVSGFVQRDDGVMVIAFAHKMVQIDANGTIIRTKFFVENIKSFSDQYTPVAHYIVVAGRTIYGVSHYDFEDTWTYDLGAFTGGWSAGTTIRGYKTDTPVCFDSQGGMFAEKVISWVHTPQDIQTQIVKINCVDGSEAWAVNTQAGTVSTDLAFTPLTPTNTSPRVLRLYEIREDVNNFSLGYTSLKASDGSGLSAGNPASKTQICAVAGEGGTQLQFILNTGGTPYATKNLSAVPTAVTTDRNGDIIVGFADGTLKKVSKDDLSVLWTYDTASVPTYGVSVNGIPVISSTRDDNKVVFSYRSSTKLVVVVLDSTGTRLCSNGITAAYTPNSIIQYRGASQTLYIGGSSTSEHDPDEIDLYQPKTGAAVFRFNYSTAAHEGTTVISSITGGYTGDFWLSCLANDERHLFVGISQSAEDYDWDNSEDDSYYLGARIVILEINDSDGSFISTTQIDPVSFRLNYFWKSTTIGEVDDSGVSEHDVTNIVAPGTSDVMYAASEITGIVVRETDADRSYMLATIYKRGPIQQTFGDNTIFLLNEQGLTYVNWLRGTEFFEDGFDQGPFGATSNGTSTGLKVTELPVFLPDHTYSSSNLTIPRGLVVNVNDGSDLSGGLDGCSYYLNSNYSESIQSYVSIVPGGTGNASIPVVGLAYHDYGGELPQSTFVFPQFHRKVGSTTALSSKMGACFVNNQALGPSWIPDGETFIEINAEQGGWLTHMNSPDTMMEFRMQTVGNSGPAVIPDGAVYIHTHLPAEGPNNPATVGNLTGTTNPAPYFGMLEFFGTTFNRTVIGMTQGLQGSTLVWQPPQHLSTIILMNHSAADFAIISLEPERIPTTTSYAFCIQNLRAETGYFRYGEFDNPHEDGVVDPTDPAPFGYVLGQPSLRGLNFLPGTNAHFPVGDWKFTYLPWQGSEYSGITDISGSEVWKPTPISMEINPDYEYVDGKGRIGTGTGLFRPFNPGDPTVYNAAPAKFKLVIIGDSTLGEASGVDQDLILQLLLKNQDSQTVSRYVTIPKGSQVGDGFVVRNTEKYYELLSVTHIFGGDADLNLFVLALADRTIELV